MSEELEKAYELGRLEGERLNENLGEPVNEMAMAEESATFLLENGFVIKNPEEFITLSNNLDLKSVIERLNALQAEAVEPVNLEAFNRNMAERLSQISDILDNDHYFNNSLQAQSFIDKLNELKNNFTAVENYHRALNLVKEKRTTLQDINERIANITKDNNMDPAIKTKETMKLAYGINVAKKDVIESEHLRDSYKAAYEASLNVSDITNYKNSLLKQINELDDLFRNIQSMSPENKDVLASLIRDTRDLIVVLDLSRQQKETEFKELCQKYSLEFIGRVDTNNLNQTIVENVEPTEPTIEEDNGLTPEVVENVEVNDEVLDITELIEKLKEVNPGVEFKLSEDEKTILASVTLENLTMPENFYFDIVDGITNRGNAKPGKHISAQVGLLERQEEKISSLEELYEALKELNPDVEFEMNASNDNSMYENIAFCDTPVEKLALPEGFYFDIVDGITNRGRATAENTINLKIKVINLDYYMRKDVDLTKVLEGCSVEELVSALKELNPEVNIEFDAQKEKLILPPEVDAKDLKLPEGFSYDKTLGINNKVNDYDPYTGIEVKTKENKLDDPVNDIQLPNFPGNDAPKEKHKVIKIRKAYINEYIAGAIVIAGLGFCYAANPLLGLGATGIAASQFPPLQEKFKSLQETFKRKFGMKDKENEPENVKGWGERFKELGKKAIAKLQRNHSEVHEEEIVEEQALPEAPADLGPEDTLNSDEVDLQNVDIDELNPEMPAQDEEAAKVSEEIGAVVSAALDNPDRPAIVTSFERGLQEQLAGLDDPDELDLPGGGR